MQLNAFSAEPDPGESCVGVGVWRNRLWSMGDQQDLPIGGQELLRALERGRSSSGARVSGTARHRSVCRTPRVRRFVRIVY